MSIATAEALIDKKLAFDRLLDNKDFQFLIEDQYFTEEAKRIVFAKADPSMQDEIQQKQLEGRMAGIGYLRQYFMCIVQMGGQALVDMAAHQETREEILAEGLDD